jgi:hypothetical protein
MTATVMNSETARSAAALAATFVAVALGARWLGVAGAWVRVMVCS